MDEKAKLLNRAHAVLAALRALDSAMAEHNEDQVGEDLARPLVAIRARLAGAADFMAERLPPVERTPEVVLRAMRAAYERAALDAAIVYFGAGDAPTALSRTVAADEMACHVRDSLAAHLSGKDAAGILLTRPLRDDYEARLRGDRPLDAPPLEEV